ncbi:hypothetical protein SynROS8604_00165 [Synechococcus sp. ROS8604]|nr:hypothetical protein SynROS8604_00165 [Synechococcus sp. ROS8604]
MMGWNVWQVFIKGRPRRLNPKHLIMNLGCLFSGFDKRLGSLLCLK